MPSRSAKNGSLRNPAKNRYGPDSATTGSVPKLTGTSVRIGSPAASCARACSPVARYTVTVCSVSVGGENTQLNATIGPVVPRRCPR